MKYVRIAEPVEVAPAVNGQPALKWSMVEAVTFVVDTAPAFQKPASAQRAAARLIAAFEAPTSLGAELIACCSDSDWAMLNEACESGETPWGAWHAVRADGTQEKLRLPPRRFLVFTNAIAEALGDESYSRLSEI